MEQSLQRLNANQRVEIWGQRIAACRNSGMTVREWCNPGRVIRENVLLLAAQIVPDGD